LSKSNSLRIFETQYQIERLHRVDKNKENKISRQMKAIRPGDGDCQKGRM
jgi:hypothetical protein